MCQYSSVEGHPTDWHLVHLGAFARGGAALVMSEATAVAPEGRISTFDAGLWNDHQTSDYERITSFIRDQGSVPGIQLAHAGRKAGRPRPWDAYDRGSYETPWTPVGPSRIPFGDYAMPHELSTSEISALISDWRAAAQRADDAGFDVIEIHAAHGYLLHQFLSPMSNHRTDEYGGSPDRRGRLLRELVDAIRSVIPDRKPLFVRISATDWTDGGLAITDAIAIAQSLVGRGVDLLDVSTGGLSPDQHIDVAPGYQVDFATEIRRATGLPVSAVGLITGAPQAEDIVSRREVDAVMFGRALLRNPSLIQQFALELNAEIDWPAPYLRARPP